MITTLIITFAIANGLLGLWVTLYGPIELDWGKWVDKLSNIMKKLLDRIPLERAPMAVKLFLAKILVRTLTIDNLENDICLFNELDRWIKTNGRPTTSSPNYWINKEATHE